ncbi:hypothetical protein V2J09_012418 [Rumex salicifolius]
MGSSSKLMFPSTIFLVLMLLFATGTILGAEARYCSGASERFRGVCVSKRNCNAVCETEGYAGGECKGLRRRCMCTRPCPEDNHA